MLNHLTLGYSDSYTYTIVKYVVLIMLIIKAVIIACYNLCKRCGGRDTPARQVTLVPVDGDSEGEMVTKTILNLPCCNFLMS